MSLTREQVADKVEFYYNRGRIATYDHIDLISTFMLCCVLLELKDDLASFIGKVPLPNQHY